MRLKNTAAFVLGASLFLSGCVTRTRVVPQNERLLPAQSRSFKDLIQVLKERSGAIKTLKAAQVLFQPSSGARRKGKSTEPLVCTAGSMLVNMPNDIRIQLKSLAGTCANIVSNGLRYEVESPFNSKFYQGNANEAIVIPKPDLQLPPPGQITTALFVDITPYLQDPKRYKATLSETTAPTPDGMHSYYILGFMDISGDDIEARLLREVWIDRTNMEISRQLMYGPDGVLETDTEFSGYQITGDAAFPKVVTIDRPLEDVSLKITFAMDHTEVNGTLPPDVFKLFPQTGYEVVEMPARTVKPQE